MENPTRYTNYRKWAVAVGTYVALLCCVPKPSKRKSPSHGCAVSEWIRQSHADHDAPNAMYSHTLASSSRLVRKSGIRIMQNVSGTEPSNASKRRGLTNRWCGLCDFL